jgi:hypothetical protein
MKYNLRVIEIAAKHSPEFSILPYEIRGNLKPGSFAKLHFIGAPNERGLLHAEFHSMFAPHVERMWVKISQVKGINDIKYEGTLANDPAFIQGLKFGDVIKFEPCHVAQILQGNGIQ